MEQWRKDARHEPIIVDLEALVPKDHLLRKIEKVMDYGWLYERLDPYYCHDNGRPGTDPVVLIKMVLIQHLKASRQAVCFGLFSGGLTSALSGSLARILLGALNGGLNGGLGDIPGFRLPTAAAGADLLGPGILPVTPVMSQ